MNAVINFFRGLSKGVKTIIFVGIVVCILLFVTRTFVASVETRSLIGSIQKKSQLITSEIIYPGYTKYIDTGIEFIDKGDFIMLYEAKASVGIDMSEVEITKNDLTKTINVKIPKCKVLSVKITGDVEFVNEKFALFNFDSREDVTRAITQAEEDAINQINNMGTLDIADEQTQNIIKGMLSPAIENGYEIKFETK